MDGGSGADGLFTAEDVEGLDAVVLLKRNGMLLTAWAREPISLDVVSVMTATLLGSVESIGQALHGEIPRTLRLETERYQLLATRVPSQAILVVVGPTAMRESELRRAARTLAPRLAGTGARVPSEELSPIARRDLPAKRRA